MATGKKCKRCNQWKNLDKFHVCRKTSDGLNPWCKLCFKKYYRLRRPSHRQLVLERYKREARKYSALKRRPPNHPKVIAARRRRESPYLYPTDKQLAVELERYDRPLHPAERKFLEGFRLVFRDKHGYPPPVLKQIEFIESLEIGPDIIGPPPNHTNPHREPEEPVGRPAEEPPEAPAEEEPEMVPDHMRPGDSINWSKILK